MAAVIVVLLGAWAGIVAYAQPHVGGEHTSYTGFLGLVRAGRVQSAQILDVDSYVVGTYARTDGRVVRYGTPFLKESRQPLIDLLDRAQVPTTIDQQNGKRAVSLASLLLPTLILVVAFSYTALSYKRGSGPFGVASGARRLRHDDARARFTDVAGQGEAVAELREITDYLADPARFAAVGAAVPKGVLLAGPPGCGKTLLAKAVAGEAQAAFFSVAASDFVELYVGVGAARVRDLFREARESAPSIVFIDEVDSLGARRATTASHGEGEREQTVNQILVELDGFDATAGVIVMAATNRPDLLDPAMVRPGRFDRLVTVTLPDRAGRQAILALHAAGKSLGADVDLAATAGLTQGFSGADLANVLNEAVLLAARRGLPEANQALLEEAVDRAVLGVASRGTVLSEDERARVAWHEAGHALLALTFTGTARAPHKLTIVPRGATFGRCIFVDGHDRQIDTRSQLFEQMTVGMGGWVAEQLAFGEPSSASGSDLSRVGQIARRMVREFGMSDALGPVALPEHAGSEAWQPSEDLRRAFDGEVRSLVDGARANALAVLTSGRSALDRVAEALLARETLTLPELVELTAATPLADHRPRTAAMPVAERKVGHE